MRCSASSFENINLSYPHSRLVLIMALCYIVLTGLKPLRHNSINGLQRFLFRFRRRNKARLEFHLGAVRERDRLKRAENAVFIHGMNNHNGLF